jgi:hypothetical protein
MKTSYFAKSSGNPGAISIALYPPKGSKMRSYKDLAPTSDMIRMTNIEQYSRLYNLRILSKLDPNTVYTDLCELVEPNEPVLLCFEKSRFNCHRGLVSEWFALTIGIQVDELMDAPDEQRKLF